MAAMRIPALASRRTAEQSGYSHAGTVEIEPSTAGEQNANLAKGEERNRRDIGRLRRGLGEIGGATTQAPQTGRRSPRRERASPASVHRKAALEPSEIEQLEQ